MTARKRSLLPKDLVIYKATNSLSKKMYIGLTRYGLEDRRARHVHDVRAGSSVPFHAAIRKYGIEAFAWEVIQSCCSEACLRDAEIWWIANLNTLTPNGYNVSRGGDLPPVGPEITRKIQESLDRNGTRKRGEKHHYWGKKRPPESVEKMRETMRRNMTPELRAKRGDSQRGRPLTENQKRALREGAARARILSPWKMSETSKIAFTEYARSKRSKETRERISVALKGREVPWIKGKPKSEETRRRMREAWQNRSPEERYAIVEKRASKQRGVPNLKMIGNTYRRDFSRRMKESGGEENPERLNFG
jgi:group I intron endonuclease